MDLFGYLIFIFNISTRKNVKKYSMQLDILLGLLLGYFFYWSIIKLWASPRKYSMGWRCR